MNLRKLEVFSKVVELKSFTKAARVFAISQPSVSEQIRSLEDVYHEKLLDRNGGFVVPTQSGRILYDYAQDILRLHQQAIVAFETQKDTALTGQLTVGASKIPGTYILPDHIGSFTQKHPAVKITINIDASRDIATRVASKELDFGIVSSGINDPRLEWEKLFDEKILCAVSPSHAFAQRDGVRLDELRDEPFLLLDRNSGTRKFVAGALKKGGFPANFLRIAAEMGNIEAIRRGVKSGMGISLLPEHALHEDVAAGTLKAIPIEQAEMDRPFYIVTRKGHQLSASCEVFRSHLAGAIREAHPATVS